LASAGYRVTLLAPGIPTGIVQSVVCVTREELTVLLAAVLEAFRSCR